MGLLEVAGLSAAPETKVRGSVGLVELADGTPVTAPADGIFVRTTTLSTVSTGERVATLGLF